MNWDSKTVLFVGSGLKRTAETGLYSFPVRFLANRECLVDLFAQGKLAPSGCVVFLHLEAADELGPFFRRIETEIPHLFLLTPIVACFDGSVHGRFEPFYARFDGLLPVLPRPEQVESIVAFAALKKQEWFEKEKRLSVHKAVVRDLAEEPGGVVDAQTSVHAEPQGMYYSVDERGIVSCVSDEVLRIIGFSRDEIVGRHFSELVSTEVQEQVLLAFTERRTGERRAKDILVRFRKREGGWEELQVDAHGVHIPAVFEQPHKDQNRLYIGTIGLPKKKGKLEQAIDIFERSLKPIIIYGLEDRRLIVNHGFEQFSGYAQDELFDKSPELFEKPDKTFFRNCLSILPKERRCIYNTVVVTKQGDERFCEVALDLIDYEEKQYVIAIYNDLTSIMQLLDEAETLIRLSWYTGNVPAVQDLIQSSSEQIAAVLKAPFYAVGILKEDMAGAADNSGAGDTVERFYVHSEKKSGWLPLQDAVFRRGLEPLIREALTEKKTVYRSAVEVVQNHDIDDFTDLRGGYFFVVTPLLVNNEPIGFTVVLHESDASFTLRGIRLLEISTNVVASGIYKLRLESELRKNIETLESRVKERTKELEDFIYTVSHDLKSPLHAARGFAEMVLTQFKPFIRNEDDEYIVRRIGENVSEAITMINDLLKLSRIGTQELRFEKVDLGEIIQDYGIQFRAFKRPDAALDILIANDIPPVKADRGRIVQLVVNIFDNSVKYRRAKNVQIVVGCEARGGRLHLSVKDNGVGIKEEELRNVFKIFYRIKSDGPAKAHVEVKGHSEAVGAEGSGLGLSIAKKIVEQHGGSIELRSVWGEGTTALFDLPLYID